jgi:transposase
MKRPKISLRQQIRELQAQLDEEVGALRAENEALKLENQRLRKRIRELEELVSDSERSSRRQAAPFRRSKTKAQPKKPGRKKGHPGAKRERPEKIDRSLKASPLKDCERCGHRLVDLKTHENYQTDLPPVVPVVTRFEFESGWCESCHQRAFSRHPEQISTAVGAAASHLGPRVLALVADWKGRLGLPLRKIAGILKDQFGLEVTAGALAQANARLAERAKPTLEAMKQALAEEDLVHADETGWRIAASSAWLWVICSERFTCYEITSHRCATVVAELLGEDFEGLVMRDGWSSYDARLNCAMLRCLVHLQRNAQALEDAQEGEAAEAAGHFVLWLEGVFALRRAAEELDEAQYRREAAEMIAWFEEFVGETHNSEANQRFADRLGKIRKHVLPIVEDPELPATNNLAERQIRPGVLHRKVSAGNKTAHGASVLATLASLATSCHQQGMSFAQWVERLLLSAPGQTVPFWLSPDPEPG